MTTDPVKEMTDRVERHKAVDASIDALMEQALQNGATPMDIVLLNSLMRPFVKFVEDASHRNEDSRAASNAVSYIMANMIGHMSSALFPKHRGAEAADWTQDQYKDMADVSSQYLNTHFDAPPPQPTRKERRAAAKRKMN